MEIRSETEKDFEHVRDLHAAAFPSLAEANLVERLRADGESVLSLVAIDEGVVGHVMFSRMTAPFPALGLAPVSVRADWRKQGIAALLIREGLAQANSDGWKGVFVLGSPDYYRRFGFDPGLAARFESPYAGPYLMAVSLQNDGLPCDIGKVAYAPAFADLD